jgi:hypothetical protein
MAGRNRITIQTSVRAFYSIGLGIDRAISTSWKKGGPICNKAMTPQSFFGSFKTSYGDRLLREVLESTWCRRERPQP